MSQIQPITADIPMPDYYQFPRFLLELELSTTAMLTYMVLFDRLRLSLHNGWLEQGRAYCSYPIEALAREIRKSPTSVKTALRELKRCGLIEKESCGVGKTSKIYMAVSEGGIRTPETCPGGPKTDSDADGKPSSPRSENGPYRGRKTVLTVDGKRTGNKVIESSKENQNEISQSERSNPRALGSYANVFLSEESLTRLRKTYPGRLDELIEQMSSYIAAGGKQYINFEAALDRWAKRERESDPCRRNPPAGRATAEERWADMDWQAYNAQQEAELRDWVDPPDFEPW